MIQQLIRMIRELPSLISIDLSNNHLGSTEYWNRCDSGFEMVKEDDCFPDLATAITDRSSLTSINLNGNFITDHDMCMLAQKMDTLSSLTFLDFGTNYIERNGMCELAARFSSIPFLTSINLSDNSTSTPLYYLKDLAKGLMKLPNLTSLDLSANTIKNIQV